jgi:hypothetical protein
VPESAALRRLLAEDLVELDQGRARTTRRWQRAMLRAAAALYGNALPFDLRYPIALALVELLGSVDDAELCELVEALLPLEQAALPPSLRASPPSGTTRP